MSKPLIGAFPVLPTIFDSTGQIDEAGLKRVLDYVIHAGAAGIVFPGLASEYDCLTQEERLHLTAKIGEWNQGRVHFIVGASSLTPEDSARFALAGARAGASAAMIMTPHAYAHDLTEMAAFYEQVGAQTSLPLMLQNAPAPMGIGLSLEHVASIVSEVPAITYVKEEAAPSGQRISRLAELTHGELSGILGGAGGRYLIDELSRGAVGSMPACEITEIHAAIIKHFLAGEEKIARDLFERSLPLLNVQANFRWRLTKEVLRRRGLIESTYTRAKGPSLDAYDLKEVDALLARIKDLTGIS